MESSVAFSLIAKFLILVIYGLFCPQFIEKLGLSHMFSIFKSGSLEMKEDEAWSQVTYCTELYKEIDWIIDF